VLLPFPRCAATARPERLGRALRGRPAARVRWRLACGRLRPLCCLAFIVL
jgi:hypothetical protein